MVALSLLVAGCSSRPSAQVRYEDAERVYNYTTTLADAVVAQAREVFPELTFDLNYTQKFDDDWSPCSDEPYPNGGAPRAFDWTPSRTLLVSPADPPGTVHLVEPIAQVFLDNGWTVAYDHLDHEVGQSLMISKDGVSVRFTARPPDAPENMVNDLIISVIGPCQFSPDDFADFDPADPEAYFGDD